MGAYIDITVLYPFWVNGNRRVIILPFTGFGSSQSFDIKQFLSSITTPCSHAALPGLLFKKIVKPAYSLIGPALGNQMSLIATILMLYLPNSLSTIALLLSGLFTLF